MVWCGVGVVRHISRISPAHLPHISCTQRAVYRPQGAAWASDSAVCAPAVCGVDVVWMWCGCGVDVVWMLCECGVVRIVWVGGVRARGNLSGKMRRGWLLRGVLRGDGEG